MLIVCKLYLGKLVFITCHYTRYKWQWKIGKHRAHIASMADPDSCGMACCCLRISILNDHISIISSWCAYNTYIIVKYRMCTSELPRFLNITEYCVGK